MTEKTKNITKGFIATTKLSQNIIELVLSENNELAMTLIKSQNIKKDMIKRIDFRISIKENKLRNHFKNKDALNRCLRLFENEYIKIAEPLDYDSVHEMIDLEKEKINKISMEKDVLVSFLDELLKPTKKEDQ